MTIEEPIEKYFFEQDGEPLSPDRIQEEYGFDYTPRAIGKDVADLGTALMKDALRQTPSCVYVGELRSKDDLRTAFEFAKTGHLVVSTLHAGSVVDAMDRAFAAMEAKTPQERGSVASLLRGVVHLKLLEVGGKEKALVPGLWKGTPQGIAAVVADGLSALLPHRPVLTDDQAASSITSVGRTALVEMLTHGEAGDPRSRRELFLKCVEEDLTGL